MKDHGAKVVEIRAGTDIPVFFVPTAFGDYSYIYELAREINSKNRIYALTWRSSDANQLTTLEAIAEEMIQLMRQVQPTGPYRVAGYSAGGILAYTIAQQLEANDEMIAFLGLIDTSFTRSDHMLTPEELFIYPDDGKYRNSPEKEVKQIKRTIDYAKDQGFMDKRLDTGVECAKDLQVRQYIKATSDYQADPIYYTIDLFIASEQPEPLTKENKLGWEALNQKGNIREWTIPGDHCTIIENVEHRRELGQAIGAAIALGATNTIARESSQIVPFVLRRSSPDAIFCIPGAGASITSLMSLTTALRTSFSIFGVQPRGTDATSQPHASVVASAREYVRKIQAIHSAGSIQLIGHSHGGRVAFEVACMLQSIGRVTDKVVLLDSEAPDGEGMPVKDIHFTEIQRLFHRAIEKSFDLNLPIPEKTVRLCRDQFLRSLHEQMRRQKLVSQATTPRMLEGPLAVFAAAIRTNYVPTSQYGGPVLLLQASEPDEYTNNHALLLTKNGQNWRLWAPRLDVRAVPGNHFSMLNENNVHTLINYIQQFAAKNI